MRNLGNVAGIVLGGTPPTNADGTPKNYVLWGKIISTNPIKYTTHYYDPYKESWLAFSSMRSEIEELKKGGKEPTTSENLDTYFKSLLT